MTSRTDRIIRDVHEAMRRMHPDVGESFVLDHLAWETGAAASGLVNPGAWVRRALLDAGLCDNPSEAQARMARAAASRPIQRSHLDDPSGRLAAELFERDVEALCLPIHARLESCPIEELDQAATTVINLAIEHGDVNVLEDVVACLVVFGSDWGGGRWWTTGSDHEASAKIR